MSTDEDRYSMSGTICGTHARSTGFVCHFPVERRSTRTEHTPSRFHTRESGLCLSFSCGKAQQNNNDRTRTHAHPDIEEPASRTAVILFAVKRRGERTTHAHRVSMRSRGCCYPFSCERAWQKDNRTTATATRYHAGGRGWCYPFPVERRTRITTTQMPTLTGITLWSQDLWQLVASTFQVDSSNFHTRRVMAGPFAVPGPAL
ncbi:hypothetical protein FIBSPDRAFT_442220 [Athelia psychrophila]|uniref:Uncharacterized protein n=1 Tax=Athelia psychrophila TaxID=1759441 RepID=A0A166MHI6_9AGAM|nr:hypothetical protein FIBSPDRAFT_442220 [Fibularhizoctonia sp. CBS 109695]